MLGHWVLAAVVATTTVAPVGGFYIPGTAPNEFTPGAVINVKAVKLTSTKIPLPYEYYFLPFCKPENAGHRSENLGEVLHGDRITNTPYQLRVNVNETCRVVECGDAGQPGRMYSRKDVAKLTKFIRQRYRASWLLDNLPAATRPLNEDRFIHGFPIGYYSPKTGTSLFNHVVFIVKYHKLDDSRFRIVGFEVQPASFDISSYESLSGGTCSLKQGAEKASQILDFNKMEKTDSTRIVWTYSVRWQPSDVAWASRWDTYLKMPNTDIHWFSIVNSLATVFILSVAFAFILVRTLSADIARYNEEGEDDFDDIEPTGWKLVAGDVFRPPPHIEWLTTFIGTGIELLVMSVVTILFACFGMLSPSSRGALMTEAIVAFVLAGAYAGFHAGRFYRTFGGQNWKQQALLLALFFPGLVFGLGFLLNLLIWGKQSSGAVPFTTMIALLLIWFGVSVPLVTAGFFFGFRKQAYAFPGVVNQIARQIPPQKWFLQAHVSTLVAGLFPFAAIYIELYFILSAIWGNAFYYLFGFLFLVFLVLVVVCSELTIVLVYLQLCSEDYRWWWRSFLHSGSCAIFAFLYSVLYFTTSLSNDELTATLLYFGYTALMCFALFIMTGTIGFVSSFIFVSKIYGAVKID
eukprot:m.66175 g.66175  ORF g.66175 m.66175 type:complete len:632 (-) comp13723_c0_seq1:123-2018(-)